MLFLSLNGLEWFSQLKKGDSELSPSYFKANLIVNYFYDLKQFVWGHLRKSVHLHQMESSVPYRLL